MNAGSRSFLSLALASLLAAAVLHLLLAARADVPGTWHAMVHLLLLGWTSGMILAVLHHVMPVFTGKDFPHPWLPVVNAALLASGVALTAAAWLGAGPSVMIVGLGLETAAAVTFVADVLLLVQQGTSRRTRLPIAPVEGQERVDKVGTFATNVATLCWPLGVGLLLAQAAGFLGGTWLLAGEHVLTLGWILLMICGVAYHVLPRFSGRPTRGVTWARAQVTLHVTGVALAATGLGFGKPVLLASGAPLIALSLMTFAWTVWPTLVAVRPGARVVQVSIPRTMP